MLNSPRCNFRLIGVGLVFQEEQGGADEVERENMSTNFLDLFKTRPNLHRTICGCLVQAMTQYVDISKSISLLTIQVDWCECQVSLLSEIGTFLRNDLLAPVEKPS